MAPYAEVTSTDFTYTGQRDLTGTGLMDYRARFYSPALKRFIQPDSIIPGAANPQAWNRFSYGLNNPSRYTDPSGHQPLLIAALVVLVFGVALLVGYGNNVANRARVPTPYTYTTATPSYTPTPTHTGQPPYKNTFTPTMNPTLSSLLTATPTGTLPTAGPDYLSSGSTSTSTIAPTTTPMPIDYGKLPKIIGDDIVKVNNAAEELCTASANSCSEFIPNPQLQKRVQYWEFFVDVKDFVNDLLDREIKSTNYQKPPYPTGTATPAIVPAPVPRPPTPSTPIPYSYWQ